MLDRLKRWWRDRSTRDRVHAVLLVLLVAGVLAHQAVVWNWYIEDAAISFAYARNLVDGYGLVPSPGAERVEGYSNPTWVALMALFDLVGIDSFGAAKGVQLVLAAISLPALYALTRSAAEPESDAPILAAGFLAGNAQFAIWGGCGLENGLFNTLLVLALLRMFQELRDGRAGIHRQPLSAGLWLLLALTRPEGIAYAAVGGFFSMAFSLADGRGLRPTLKWLAVFWVPFLAYHAVRFQYFAWEFPQTFYGKIGDHRDPKPMSWEDPGWNYLRRWGRNMGQGYLAPVYLIGLSGAQGTRALLVLTLGFAAAMPALLVSDQRLLLPVVLVFTFLLYLPLVRTPKDEPRPGLAIAGLLVVGAFVGAAEYMRAQGARSAVDAPDWVGLLPPYLLLGVAVVAPVFAWGVSAARERVVAWCLLCLGLGFAVAVHGDWMAGWRWMSLVAIPGSMLLGFGAEAIGRLAQATLVHQAAPGPIALLAATVLVVAPAPANVLFSIDFAQSPVTGPFSVRQRVAYKDRILDTLHGYGPIVDLDVDMGAHLMWAPDHRMIDIAGLVDIPFAQHRMNHDFIQEYVFEERRPELAHIHGGWASNSRINSFPSWREDYVEIPGYPTGEQLHIGNFVRRELIFEDHWFQSEGRRVAFEDGVELAGWRLPSPVAGQGRRLYLELGIQTHRRVDTPFRVIAFLAEPGGAAVVSWDLPPAYDWIPQAAWRRSEIFVGRFSPQLPEDLPEGEYELGFVLIGAPGGVLAASSDGLPAQEEVDPRILGGVDGEPARVARGEVRFPGAVRIVSDAESLRLANADRDRAVQQAADGLCGEAVRDWSLARARRPRAKAWFASVGPETDRAIADCYAAMAQGDPDNAVAHLIEARWWDALSPAVDAAAQPVADAQMAEGAVAWEARDWESAYRAYSDAVAVDPSRSWARRWAEKARAERLGIAAENKRNEPLLSPELRAERRRRNAENR